MTDQPEISRSHEDRSRRFWNRSAREGLGERMEAWNRSALERLLKDVRREPGSRYLDIGCGEGWAVERIALLDPQAAVVGIDPAEDFIDRARMKLSRFENVMFAAASAEEIPWAGDYFDFVLAMDSAEFWSDPVQAAREALRVTAYGGTIHLVVHCFDGNPHTSHWQDSLGVDIHRWSQEQWVDLLESAGFTEVQAAVLPGSMPLPLRFRGEPFWRSRAEFKAFQQSGSLHLTAVKPGLPAEPDSPPFRIWR